MIHSAIYTRNISTDDYRTRGPATHPNQVPYLLLLEPDKAIKHGILELLQERAKVDAHLVFVEFIFQTRSLGVPARSAQLIVVRVVRRQALLGRVKERLVLGDVFDGGLDGIHILGPRQGVVTLREQPSDRREQPRPLFLGQLCSKRVQRDIDCTSVRFEREDTGHEFVCGCWKGLTKVGKVFKVGFVEGVADDFNVEVVEVLRGEAILEVWRCRHKTSIEAGTLESVTVPSGVSTITL